MADSRIKPLGDTATRIQLGEGIDPQLNRRVRTACAALERAALPGVVEWVPSYTAVTVHYQPHVVRFQELSRKLEAVLAGDKDAPVPPGKLVTLPVLYG